MRTVRYDSLGTPWSFVGACGVFIVVIALAATAPLRRALATDPATASRAD